MAHAVDRQGISATVFNGLAQPSYSPESPANKVWYNPNIVKYDYNLDKTRQYLDSMGLIDRDGDGIREDADGNPTVTTLVLGPQWYLEYQRFNLAADIPVMVTGVSVQVDEETFVFLVRKIETESAVLVFRDETGVPFWQTVRPLTP